MPEWEDLETYESSRRASELDGRRLVPGKRTLPRQTSMEAADDIVSERAEPTALRASSDPAVQLDAHDDHDCLRSQRPVETPASRVRPDIDIVAQGVRDEGESLPFRDHVQRAFGRHNIDHVGARRSGESGNVAAFPQPMNESDVPGTFVASLDFYSETYP